MLTTIAVAARDRRRLAEISAVATRFGLDLFLARLGLGSGGEGAGEPADLPARTRAALEELGPTFVKFGQILATRRDLLPDVWIEELEHLHSRAPTRPFEELRAEVEATLGEPPETAFASFDPQPLAAASIAQVHRATTHEGRPVVLKIRRPGIRAQIEADLRLIRHFAALVEANSAAARRFRPQALVQQLAQDLLDELDFTAEARNADRLRADLAGRDDVVVPDIHWQCTSEALLVMDYVAGVAPRSGEALRTAGIDPDAIAALGADLVLDMVLITGRFHGDPHPGNLLCLPGDRLALLDLGSVGAVSARRQQEFLTFVLSLRSGDAVALADTLAIWNEDTGAPRAAILAASERLMARHGGGPLVMSALVKDLFPLLREEGLVLPPDLLLVFKAMITMDGVLNGIAPGFDLSPAIERARAKLLAHRISPKRGADRAEALMLELDRVATEAPHLIRLLSRRLEAGQEPTGALIAQAAGKGALMIAVAIVLAAILIAAALAFG